jgi:hypothetical protein
MNEETKSRDALVQELQATRSRLAAAEEALAQRNSVDVPTPERQSIERELRQQEQRLLSASRDRER